MQQDFAVLIEKLKFVLKKHQNKALCEELGISQQAYYNALKKPNFSTYGRIIYLAKRHKISVDWLLGIKDGLTPQKGSAQ